MSSVINLAEKRRENFQERVVPDLEVVQLYQKPQATSVEYWLGQNTGPELVGVLHYDSNPGTEFLAVRTMNGFWLQDFRPVEEGTDHIRDSLKEIVEDFFDTWPEPKIITGTDCLSLYRGLKNGATFDLLEKVPPKLYMLRNELLEEEDFIREYYS